MTADSSGSDALDNSENNGHYPQVFNKLREPPKFPLLVMKPRLDETGHLKQISSELNKKGFLQDAIVSIKITEAKNLLVYFINSERYNDFLTLNKFMEGDIIEMKRKKEESCIVIKGVNKAEIIDYTEDLEKNGIEKIEDIQSKKQDVHINMVKAWCKSPQTAENLLSKKTIKIDHYQFRITKFEIKPTIMVCFNCSGYGHRAKFCKKEKKCVNCSSSDHNKQECPVNNRVESRDKFKCPRCAEQHPATYGGCIKLKDAIKSAKNLIKEPVVKKTSYAQVIKSQETNKFNEMEIRLTNLLKENQSKLEESYLNLESKINEIVTLTNLVQRLEEKITGLEKKVLHLEQETNNTQAFKVNSVNFMHDVWRLFLDKNKTIDQSSYNSKLLYYFNLKVDKSTNKLVIANQTTKSSNTNASYKSTDMFNDGQ